MSSAAHEKLILAAASLKQSSGGSWNDFAAAFEAYAAEHREACIAAPTDRVLVAQGLARAFGLMEKLFSDCIESRAKIMESRKDAGKPAAS